MSKFVDPVEKSQFVYHLFIITELNHRLSMRLHLTFKLTFKFLAHFALTYLA